MLLKDSIRASKKAGDPVDSKSFVEEKDSTGMSKGEGAEAGVACALTDTLNPPFKSADRSR